MKVKSKRIIKLKKAIPVYDIEVPVLHNFALANGCIVHNSDGSKDIADALCGSIWTCSRDLTISAGNENIQSLEDGIRALTSNTGNSLKRFANKLGAR